MGHPPLRVCGNWVTGVLVGIVIDLDVSNLPPGDSVAVLLRLRNSLLNTVLLYEGMLSGRDAPDWLNSGLQHIASVVDLAVVRPHNGDARLRRRRGTAERRPSRWRGPPW